MAIKSISEYVKYLELIKPQIKNDINDRNKAVTDDLFKFYKNTSINLLNSISFNYKDGKYSNISGTCEVIQPYTPYNIYYNPSELIKDFKFVRPSNKVLFNPDDFINEKVVNSNKSLIDNAEPLILSNRDLRFIANFISAKSKISSFSQDYLRIKRFTVSSDGTLSVSPSDKTLNNFILRYNPKFIGKVVLEDYIKHFLKVNGYSKITPVYDTLSYLIGHEFLHYRYGHFTEESKDNIKKFFIPFYKELRDKPTIMNKLMLKSNIITFEECMNNSFMSSILNMPPADSGMGDVFHSNSISSRFGSFLYKSEDVTNAKMQKIGEDKFLVEAYIDMVSCDKTHIRRKFDSNQKIVNYLSTSPVIDLSIVEKMCLFIIELIDGGKITRQLLKEYASEQRKTSFPSNKPSNSDSDTDNSDIEDNDTGNSDIEDSDTGNSDIGDNDIDNSDIGDSGGGIDSDLDLDDDDDDLNNEDTEDNSSGDDSNLNKKIKQVLNDLTKLEGEVLGDASSEDEEDEDASIPDNLEPPEKDENSSKSPSGEKKETLLSSLKNIIEDTSDPEDPLIPVLSKLDDIENIKEKINEATKNTGTNIGNKGDLLTNDKDILGSLISKPIAKYDVITRYVIKWVNKLKRKMKEFEEIYDPSSPSRKVKGLWGREFELETESPKRSFTFIIDASPSMDFKELAKIISTISYRLSKSKIIDVVQLCLFDESIPSLILNPKEIKSKALPYLNKGSGSFLNQGIKSMIKGIKNDKKKKFMPMGICVLSDFDLFDRNIDFFHNPRLLELLPLKKKTPLLFIGLSSSYTINRIFFDILKHHSDFKNVDAIHIDRKNPTGKITKK